MTALPHMAKGTFLTLMRTSAAAFEALVESLSEEQLTTPGVTGSWSVKDHLAHLAWWQQRLLTQVQGQSAERTAEPVDPLQGLSVDEINERVYQQQKDRALAEVWNDLHVVSAALIAQVETMSEEGINSPLTSLGNHPAPFWVLGNTYVHYHEHAHMILTWLLGSSGSSGP